MNQFIETMPKTELHLHLEGAIPLPALWELVKKYGAENEVGSVEDLEKRFSYKDFPHFIDTWVWKNGFLKEYEDFEFIAECVANDLADQNIEYAEAFYSPGDFSRYGLSPQKLTEAIRTGLRKVEKRIKINLVADLIRDFGPQKGRTWLEEINEVKSLGVVGIGIGGSEHEFPPEAYSEVYKRARELGFRTSAHAGEAAGAESVWGAIKELKVDRIGHGTRAGEDKNLVDFLAKNKIPIEMCPISNLRTGVVREMSEHPIKNFFESQLMVTVNTDDPKMFNNNLAMEYQLLVDTFSWHKKEIIALASNAIESSWASSSTKIELGRNLKDFSEKNEWA